MSVGTIRIVGFGDSRGAAGPAGETAAVRPQIFACGLCRVNPKQLVRAFCNDPLYFARSSISHADALILRSLYTSSGLSRALRAAAAWCCGARGASPTTCGTSPSASGFYRTRLNNPVIWLHAVSVGETAPARRSSTPCSTPTPTTGCSHHMTPPAAPPPPSSTATRPAGAERLTCPRHPVGDLGFLRHFHPRIGILMETELWPNLVEACHRTGTPLAMVNARLSARSARGCRSCIGGTRPQGLRPPVGDRRADRADGQRMTDLGARYVMITGNIKFDIAPPGDADAGRRRCNRPSDPQREILLAASTARARRPCLEAFARMCPPEVLLVLVPRHPDRFDEVARLVKRAGLKMQKRSKGVPVMADTRVWLGDSMGEMYAHYGAADVAIIGGSWARPRRPEPHRGQRGGLPGDRRPAHLQLQGGLRAGHRGGGRGARRRHRRRHRRSPSRSSPTRSAARRHGQAGALISPNPTGAPPGAPWTCSPRCCGPRPWRLKAGLSAAGNPPPSRRRSPRRPSCCAGRP